jgi:hypothetical protein
MSRKKRKKGKEKARPKSYTGIDKHKLVAKTLIPPMATLPQLKPVSWLNDRMPEMLWAALLITRLVRENALAIFRGLADLAFQVRETVSEWDCTQTAIAGMPVDVRTQIIRFLCTEPEWRESLRPLLLLKQLPGRDAWQAIIGEEPVVDDWHYLKCAVAATLDHQSESSTDCRWVRVLTKIAAGKMRFRSSMKELVEEVIHYPHQGDLHKVRPTIRSMEGGIGSLTEKTSEWPKLFWGECLSGTSCELPPPKSAVELPPLGTTPEVVRQTYAKLVQHAGKSASTTAIDAKHDAVFGIAFYSLAVLLELLQIGIGSAILGRMGMRCLVECYVTLAYLLGKNSPELWKKYRNYGAGQAKLSFLKLADDPSQVTFATANTLRTLANEDMWEELLEIGLGHWSGSDLRKMSEEAGVKTEYDKFYSWTSGFVHGQWGAIRDSVFCTCQNPLHRLHRIPRPEARHLEDVVPDAAYLVDRILTLLDRTYPSFASRVSVKASS